MKANLMKNKKAALCLLFPLLLQTGAAIAGGTGVGSGTDGEREVTIAEMAAQLQLPPTNAAQLRQSDLALWCNGVINILQRAQLNSQNELEQSNYALSYHILLDSLRVALQSMSNQNNPNQVLPHTRKLVEQAVRIGMSLEALGNHPADLLVRRELLKGMIDFISNQIRTWDIQIYLPYQYHQTYGRCQTNCPPSFDIAAYNLRLLGVAAQTIDTVNRSLLMTVNGQPRPMGSAGLATANYLKAIEMLSGMIAQDLHENLFEIQNACVITDLEALATDLANYNNGQGSIYRTPARALRGTFERIQSIRARLVQNSTGCVR